MCFIAQAHSNGYLFSFPCLVVVGRFLFALNTIHSTSDFLDDLCRPTLLPATRFGRFDAMPSFRWLFRRLFRYPSRAAIHPMNVYNRFTGARNSRCSRMRYGRAMGLSVCIYTSLLSRRMRRVGAGSGGQRNHGSSNKSSR